MADYKKILKKIFTYHEPQKVERFILKEKQSEGFEKGMKKEPNKEKGDLPKVIYKRPDAGGEQDKKVCEEKLVSIKLDENSDYLKRVYSVPENGDIVLREFDITVGSKIIRAFIIFYDGMTNDNIINSSIMQPLMLLSNLDIKGRKGNLQNTSTRQHAS